MSATLDELREHVFGLQIVDTHEHVAGAEAKRDRKMDVLGEYLTHYFSCDLVSAGLTPEQLETARDASVPLRKRWRLVAPFWDAARHTGYGRSLDIAARDLYGLERIDGRTIGALDEAFAAARAAGGWYEQVLKKRSKIRISILDGDLECDRRYFRSTVRLDDFVMVWNIARLRGLEQRCGAKIHTLSDLEDGCERVLDEALARGAACLKSGLAYERPLRYEKVARAEAEAEFNDIWSDREIAAGGREGVVGRTRKLQDHMMHHVCRLADRRGLPFQIHTGIHEGIGNYVYHSDPALLTNLFMEYADVRFDVFHIGYPYQQTLSVLAKNFRNVFIDFCWAHIISPAAARAALAEYLDAVPANKISAFGGDYCFVDGIYGHQFIARQNVARVLAEKVDEGVFDLDRAKELARMLLHDNPVAIFRLAETLEKPPRRRGERK